MKKIGAFLLSAVMTMTMTWGNVSASAASSTETEPKLIALTFDDGPNTTTTNEVLDLMAEYDAKATFFLIGRNINEESAAVVKRAYDMGMEIGNHSKTHGNMGDMTADEITAEITFVDEKVVEITGESTTYFRPPFIDTSDLMYATIEKTFICGIDTYDYMQNVTAEERAQNILDGAKDGVIVLMHDAAGNDQTVEALKIAMPQLQAQGYEFVTLSELFEKQGETPRRNILYSQVAKYPCNGYTLHQSVTSDATDKIRLDTALLEELDDRYAIEVEYSSNAYAPIVALQSWTSTPSIWKVIQPFYFNGDRAVFLAEDILGALEELSADYTDLDAITLAAYSGEITMSNAKILVKPEGSGENNPSIAGDMNGDGKFSVADILLFQKWLCAVPDTSFANLDAANFCDDGVLNVLDLTAMKHALISE